MDRKTLISCTAAIVLTMLGCAWWLHRSIESNADWMLRDLEQLRR